MEGRASKMKTSLLLGDGEGLLFSNLARKKELGFHLEGFALKQLISLTRLIDDGSIASWVYCMKCLRAFIGEAWGDDQGTSPKGIRSSD